jgi:hypothetical protein
MLVFADNGKKKGGELENSRTPPITIMILAVPVNYTLDFHLTIS